MGLATADESNIRRMETEGEVSSTWRNKFGWTLYATRLSPQQLYGTVGSMQSLDSSADFTAAAACAP